LAPRRAAAFTIPQASLRRLPQYHYFLVQLAQTGITQVSCSVIGQALNCIPVQVRKDLQYTGIVGRPKTGYPVHSLIHSIETFLGWNSVNEAFLVGVGNLGTALLGHERFTSFGLRIMAAFDTDPAKIGTRICQKPVLSFDKLPDLARRMSIRLGIITTPAEAAQTVADAMLAGGILAIWNFAPVRLRVPETISVHNEDLYSSLASLSWQLARRLHVPVNPPSPDPLRDVAALLAPPAELAHS
jgi:redox-sensing transcriptional repressor